MVLGGTFENAGTAVTDVYDPALGTWQPGAPLNSPRAVGATVALSNGWLVTVGGGPNVSEVTDTAEMYVPEADRWLPIAPMPAPRRRMAAVRLADDRVLVAGGLTTGSDIRSEAWIYDYRADTWTPTAPLSTGRQDAQAKLLPDGRVLLVSGTDGGGSISNTSEIWDPATGAWTVVPMAGSPTFDFALVTLPSGAVAAVSGAINVSASHTEIRVFDPATMIWTVAGTVLTGRRDPEAVVLPDGRLLVVGGMGAIETIESPEIVTMTRGRDASRLPTLAPPGTLVNSGAPTIDGTGFYPTHTGSGNTSGNSSSNLPLTLYRSLATGDQGLLPLETWTDTSAALARLAGRSLGPAVVDVRVNGIASDPRLTTVSAAGTTRQLDDVNVLYGPADRTVTLTARVASPVTPIGGGIALFLVTTSGGALVGQIGRSPAIAGDGLATASYVVPAGSYVLTVIYAGDALHEPGATSGALRIGAVPTTLTIQPDPTTVAQGGTVQITASVTPAEGAAVAGTITITNGEGSCVVAAPSGACALTFSQVGTATISATFAPATPDTHLGSTAQAAIEVTSNEPEPPDTREYTLAEGVTNGFFTSFVLIANPNASEAPITLTYAGEGGGTATESRTLAPFSRVTIPTGAGSVAETVGANFSTRVTSDTGLPLLVERATYFDETLHAGDLSGATEGGSTAWHFAEGANGSVFHTYLSLGNFGANEATVTVQYLPEAGAAVERQYTVAPNSRATIDTLADPELAASTFGMSLLSSIPIAADRVQYFGGPFAGGHADSGARELSQDWYFAEGASGPVFDASLLLANPSAEAANVAVTYHTDLGEAIAKTYAVPAGARRTVGVEGEDPRLAFTTFWMEVHADRPIVAERAMYVIRDGAWVEATATTGTPAPGPRWGLAEGIAGMALDYLPYVLIANPGAEPAAITIQYLRTTGDPVSHSYTVPAQGRLTLDVRAEEPSLADSEFAIVVSSTNGAPIVVERSQYWTFGGPGLVGAMSTMATPLAEPPQP